MPDNPLLSQNLALTVEMFLTAKEGAHVSARTLTAYRLALGKFTAWLIAHDICRVDAIAPHTVRLYFAELGKSDLAAWSVHDYARVVKTWLRFLFADGILTQDVMSRVEMPKLPKLTLPDFTPSEARDLLEACADAMRPERDTALVLFLLDTGVRASELCALTLADVDTKTGAVAIHKGKGGKDRTAYIGTRARRALLRYLLTRPEAAPRDPLFPSQTTGQAMTRNGLLQLCRRLGKRADLEDCHPHKFRRTAAIWSLRAGMDLLRLAAMLGHEDLKTLRGYLRFVEADLADAHKAHGAVDRLLK